SRARTSMPNARSSGHGSQPDRQARTQIAALKYNQKKHWLALFSCRFDKKYVASTMHIGQIHFHHNVAPYLYIAGYNYFHCALIKIIAKQEALSDDLPTVLPAIAKVISLDMDLSLSVYTREYWRQTENGKDLAWMVD
ncbi:MAG: protoglobin domain-containing protein, partial [Proteobacteria bacterium]|nr:protoglobin domain-containing protein [Pseudomonadota bacterium]